MRFSTTSFLAGLAIAGVLPLVARTARPLAVQATATALDAIEQAQRLFAERMEAMDDILAEARMQRLAPALSRSAAGRALIYGAIVSRPSRMSPEQARGDMAAFLASRDALHVILAGMTAFTGRVPDGVPVTIGWGTRDRLLPPRQALVAKASVPTARLVPLPGCGHVPMTDNPDRVAGVLLRGSGGA